MKAKNKNWAVGLSAMLDDVPCKAHDPASFTVAELVSADLQGRSLSFWQRTARNKAAEKVWQKCFKLSEKTLVPSYKKA